MRQKKGKKAKGNTCQSYLANGVKYHVKSTQNLQLDLNYGIMKFNRYRCGSTEEIIISLFSEY